MATDNRLLRVRVKEIVAADKSDTGLAQHLWLERSATLSADTLLEDPRVSNGPLATPLARLSKLVVAVALPPSEPGNLTVSPPPVTLPAEKTTPPLPADVRHRLECAYVNTCLQSYRQTSAKDLGGWEQITCEVLRTLATKLSDAELLGSSRDLAATTLMAGLTNQAAYEKLIRRLTEKLSMEQLRELLYEKEE